MGLSLNYTASTAVTGNPYIIGAAFVADIVTSILGDRAKAKRERQLQQSYMDAFKSLFGAEKPLEEMYSARKDIISSQRTSTLSQLVESTGYSMYDTLSAISNRSGVGGFADSGITRVMREDAAERLGAEYMYNRGSMIDRFNEQILSASQEYQDRLSELAAQRAKLQAQYVAAGGNADAFDKEMERYNYEQSTLHNATNISIDTLDYGFSIDNYKFRIM